MRVERIIEVGVSAPNNEARTKPTKPNTARPKQAPEQSRAANGARLS